MKKILLLDDNLDIVEVVEEVLAYDHYVVKSVTKSGGCLQIIGEYRPDLIILDYRLSDGNGGELCYNIKNSGYSAIPVIIFTAYMEPGLDLTTFGCDAVISKPFDLKELIEKIEILLIPMGLSSNHFLQSLKLVASI